MKTFAFLELIFFCMGLLSISSCDGLPFGDDSSEPLPVTEILDVEISPNPVIAGGRAQLKAIVKDSLRTDLVYGWVIRTAGTILGTGGQNILYTDSSSIFILVGENVGEHTAFIEVLDKDRKEGIASLGFTIVIVEE